MSLRDDTMNEKFAIMRYAANSKERPFGLQGKLLNWYIRRFRPYAVKEKEICGVCGYEIILPISNIDDTKTIDRLFERIRKDITDLNVIAVLLPAELTFEKGFFIPQGNFIKIFFVEDIIRKYAKTISKAISNIEIVIIEGDYSETCAVIKHIYNKFNYLGLILEENTREDYTQLSDFIYDDCGLNLGFGESDSHLIKEADVIISLGNKTYEACFKKNACYIELSANRKKACAVALKRSDVLVIDQFNIEACGERVSQKVYEMIMFCKSRDFRRFALSNGREDYLKTIQAQISAQNAMPRNLNF